VAQRRAFDRPGLSILLAGASLFRSREMLITTGLAAFAFGVVATLIVLKMVGRL
jgi:hypothetical protein